ncbi:MAG: hypothetical protein K0U98_04520 [Deltaproteobacteria bacterium]|nr:hypothetical protein [Deltaproteobacteria bacterium]
MSKKPGEDWEDAWRVWLDRPPRKSPEQAARAVSDRLSSSKAPANRESWVWLWRPLVAVAALLIAVAAVWLWVPWKEQKPKVMAAANELSLPSLGDDVLVIWLDSETPLYLTLASDPDGRPAESNSGGLL